MEWLLRKFAEMKGRRRAAQVIVFDGGSEVERSRSFLRGALVGIGVTSLIFAIAAPSAVDPQMLEEVQRRSQLVREAQLRVDQAAVLIGTCLDNADRLDRTLSSYRELLR